MFNKAEYHEHLSNHYANCIEQEGPEKTVGIVNTLNNIIFDKDELRGVIAMIFGNLVGRKILRQKDIIEQNMYGLRMRSFYKELKNHKES